MADSTPWSVLGDVDPATIYETQGRTGDLPSRIKPVSPDFQLCGPAFTVESPSGDNLWLHRAVAPLVPAMSSS
jgi:4-hydroxy-4-methyl-2-oxoglutarate aldolase